MAVLLHLACGPGEIRALLSVADEPVEILIERHPDLDSEGGLIGRLFQGRVRHLLPATGGAFVDIGRGADGYLDDAAGLAEGAALTVQVSRPASTDKPPGLTRRLQLAGAFLVLRLGAEGIEMSRRLAQPERERLRALLSPLLAANHGLTLRTAAATAAPEALLADLHQLQARAQSLAAAAAPGPAEPGRDWPLAALEALLPLLARERPARILVDDRPVLTRLAALLDQRMPDAAAPEPISSQRALLDGAIETALDPVVPLPGGGRLVIERTLACTTIDIDGGAGKALAVNRAAAPVVARQLRLRAIGGPVIVDFVAMEGTAARDAVQQALAVAAAADPLGLQLLGWTRLGHLELIRPRRAVPLADLLPPPAPAPERRGSPSGAADRRALATALAGLAAYASAPPRTTLVLPATAASLLRARAGAILADLAARRGEPVSLDAGELLPDTFELRPFVRDAARPISA